MEMGSSSNLVASILESSSELWLTSGTGPVEQMSILLASAFQVILSCWSSFLHLEQHQGGHLDILTSPLFQSISRLCFQSQECPSINFCLPRLVMQKVVHSE